MVAWGITQNGSTEISTDPHCPRLFALRRKRFWDLVRLLEVREDEGGGREFLVQWAGEDRNGDPWPNDWQPEKNVTADAIREFEFSCGVMNDLQLDGLDVRPLLSLARKKIANALLTCKQKEIASMHNIPLEFLAHEKLCRAFFALAARPAVLPNFTAKKSKVDRMAASVLILFLYIFYLYFFRRSSYHNPSP